MATVTDTTGLALGNIPLSTVMVDKDATVTLISGASDTILENVSGLISSAISTVWKAGGSKAATDLTSALLVSGNEGYVYNLTTDATTTSDWIEGAGKTILAGTDVAVVKSGPDYYFNALAPRDESVVRKGEAVPYVKVGNTNISGFLSGTTLLPVEVSGISGISVSGSGKKVIINGGELQSGLTQVTGTVSQLPGTLFSGVQIGDAAQVFTPSSYLGILKFAAGSNISLSGSDTCGTVTVTISASVPSDVVTGIVTDSGTATADSCGHVNIHGANGISVAVSGSAVIVDGSSVTGSVTGAKISGASSLASGNSFAMSGKTIIVPTASTGGFGVTKLSNTVDTSSGVAATPYAVNTRVGGSNLHSGLIAESLPNPGAHSGNTIYALLAALHSVDGQSES